jgi:hypothetical protein
MPSFSFGDFINAVVHIILASIYIYMVRQEVYAPDLSEDHVKLDLTPFARESAMIGGMAAILVGTVLLSLSIYFIAQVQGSVVVITGPATIHAFVELLTGVMLIVSGIAMIGGWRHSVALYLISVAAILTTTLIAMTFYTGVTRSFAIDLISMGAATVLLITGGMAVTAQYFSLVKVVAQQPGKMA